MQKNLTNHRKVQKAAKQKLYNSFHLQISQERGINQFIGQNSHKSESQATRDHCDKL